MAKVTIKTYLSPSCVLLAFDWPDGENHPDFLGFAIERTPGYATNRAAQFLFNKLDFKPITSKSQPKPSNQAPIQKFNWWDGGIEEKDQGETFSYRIIPVLGTGENDLRLQNAAAETASVVIPHNEFNGVASYFNRAVVSSQSFKKFTLTATIEKQMDWLSNGIQGAVPTALASAGSFDCAIYHLSDSRWILPAFKKFSGKGSITYFSKPIDTKSDAAIADLHKSKPNISSHKRDKVSGLMHDKFIIGYDQGRPASVLMGSTNFTPEAQTIQANVLHIFKSKDMAQLYSERADLLAANPSGKAMPVNKGWLDVKDLHDAAKGESVRVFFLPEHGKDRVFLDSVVSAVQAAKTSVLFCMFTATDKPLMDAIFAVGDANDKLIYGLLNSIDDPEKPTKSGKPRKVSATAVEIFHRSTQKPDTIPYAAFDEFAPAGWLPELKTIDVSKYDISANSKAKASKVKSGKAKAGANIPPVHVHHKFIVIDGDTKHPTIFTGSPNFSKNAENANDENALEIKGNLALTEVYVAEFLRLYNHYRARALWEAQHGPKSKTPKKADVLVLKTTRDEWVRGSYKNGTKEFLARTRFF